MMRNPLHHRFKRELMAQFPKYLALFLFLVFMISFISGFLVADASMSQAYNETFDKYNIESGHFILSAQPDPSQLEEIEQKGVQISSQFYKDTEYKKDKTIRVFNQADRNRINKPCLMEGNDPKQEDEIVLDRLFASNNELKIGDRITIDQTKYTITGLIALPDYSCLFADNTQMMFDASDFGVSLTTEAGYQRLPESHQIYSYVWKNEKKTSYKNNGKAVVDKFKDIPGLLTDFVREEENQAIHFTGDDIGRDRIMMMVLLYVTILIIAFIFAISARSTIEKESRVIGTLRASGYTKNELLRHYILLPTAIVLAAAAIGNLAGYTVMKNIVAGLYYHSYSLTTYTTIYNGDALLQTTVIPCVLIIAIHILILSGTLALSPIRFLRHDLHRIRLKRAIRLPNWSFMNRFRARVILQNFPAYLTMLVGILFASILLMFGLAMKPMLDKYSEDIHSSLHSKYQYILKQPVPTQIEGAEEYSAYTLENDIEEFTVFGIKNDSRYFKKTPLYNEKEVTVSQGYLEKYNAKVGDTIRLKKKYSSKTYTFTIKDTVRYDAGLAIFMPQADCNRLFDLPKDGFTGYFSDKKLTDIDDLFIASIVTEKDMNAVSRQLNDSIGGVMNLIWIFALMTYIIVIYILSKLIIERNTKMISMVKILGYNNREISKLYNRATTLVVAVSLLIT
ncbi:MAG: ABC transporter permease, partial [Erysipelotrichaceae bacterium]|nr:ABC transporter permease [Erysipelotrichaceae bacterium]